MAWRQQELGCTLKMTCFLAGDVLVVGRRGAEGRETACIVGGEAC